jgi:hypothetical protein
MRVSSPLADHVAPRPLPESGSTEALRPARQPVPEPTQPPPDRPPEHQQVGPGFWGYADRFYALLRYIVPGVLSILAGALLLFRANVELGAVLVVVGLVLIILGMLVWPGR